MRDEVHYEQARLVTATDGLVIRSPAETNCGLATMGLNRRFLLVFVGQDSRGESGLQGHRHTGLKVLDPIFKGSAYLEEARSTAREFSRHAGPATQIVIGVDPLSMRAYLESTSDLEKPLETLRAYGIHLPQPSGLSGQQLREWTVDASVEAHMEHAKVLAESLGGKVLRLAHDGAFLDPSGEIDGFEDTPEFTDLPVGVQPCLVRDPAGSAPRGTQEAASLPPRTEPAPAAAEIARTTARAGGISRALSTVPFDVRLDAMALPAGVPTLPISRLRLGAAVVIVTSDSATLHHGQDFRSLLVQQLKLIHGWVQLLGRPPQARLLVDMAPLESVLRLRLARLVAMYGAETGRTQFLRDCEEGAAGVPLAASAKDALAVLLPQLQPEAAIRACQDARKSLLTAQAQELGLPLHDITGQSMLLSGLGTLLKAPSSESGPPG